MKVYGNNHKIFYSRQNGKTFSLNIIKKQCIRNIYVKYYEYMRTMKLDIVDTQVTYKLCTLLSTIVNIHIDF